MLTEENDGDNPSQSLSDLSSSTSHLNSDYIPDIEDMTECLGSKAGMKGYDKARTKAIVQSMSIGSRFHDNEERKLEAVQNKIKQFLVRRDLFINEIDATHRSHIIAEGKRLLEDFKSIHPSCNEKSAINDHRSVWNGPCFCHFDLDMFFCAVEILHNPQLKDKPMAVGSVGMIATANYEARKYGIRAGMPGFIASKLCKDLILMPPRFDEYGMYSDLFKKTCEPYDTKYQAKTLDELSMEITNAVQGFNRDELESFVSKIRQEIFTNTKQLTCSAGIGATRLVAKVGSNLNKPNGQYVVWWTNTLDFMKGLECSQLPGIGRVRTQVLKSVGIVKVPDIWHKSGLILYLFTASTARFILKLSCGHSADYSVDRKSIGNERSFNDTNDLTELLQTLRKVTDGYIEACKKLNLWGKTITLKVKNDTFIVKNLTHRLPTPATDKEVVFKLAVSLFKRALLEKFKIEVSDEALDSLNQTTYNQIKRTPYKLRQSYRLLGIQGTGLIPFERLTTTSLKDFTSAHPQQHARPSEPKNRDFKRQRFDMKLWLQNTTLNQRECQKTSNGKREADVVELSD